MTVIERTTDLQSLLRWRREVVNAVFGMEPAKELMKANDEYYRRHVADGTHIAYVVKEDGVEVGCGSICLSDELPSPDNPSGKCAYLMNIYIREPFRRRGHARELAGKLVETARKAGCDKIYLEATESATGLYASLGFRNMENMMKYGDTDF